MFVSRVGFSGLGYHVYLPPVELKQKAAAGHLGEFRISALEWPGLSDIIHFVVDRTYGRAVLCPSVVCLSSVTYVLWLNGFVCEALPVTTVRNIDFKTAISAVSCITSSRAESKR